jgi:hypothetical protein
MSAGKRQGAGFRLLPIGKKLRNQRKTGIGGVPKPGRHNATSRLMVSGDVEPWIHSDEIAPAKRVDRFSPDMAGR